MDNLVEWKGNVFRSKQKVVVDEGSLENRIRTNVIKNLLQTEFFVCALSTKNTRPFLSFFLTPSDHRESIGLCLNVFI